MKVLYWNVCNEANNEAIAREVKELMVAGQIDVACLSEVPYETRQQEGRVRHLPLSEIIAVDLGMDSVFEHTRTIGRPTDERLRGYGTAIISRSKIMEQETHVLRDDPRAYMTPGEANKRVLMSVKTEANPDIEVSVAHLSYPMPLRRAIQGLRSERDRLFSLLSDKVKAGKLIFGGDMNVRPGGPLDALLEKLKLKNIVDPLTHTFRSRHWFAGHAKRNLDRVFVSPGVKATATVDHPRQSDHRPIIVEID